MAEAALEIDVGAQPFDIAFHPSASLVAVSLITGHLQLYKYGDGEEPQKLWNVSAHSESCRAVRFAEGGQFILTASPDRSILATDAETGKAVARLSDAHGAAINRLVNCTETTIASGDDEGTIKVWDTRHNACCSSFDAHVDFVADMEYVQASNQLLGVSGDGTLSVCNLRRNKNGRKVVCGSQDGVLLLYSWGAMLDCSDRFVGHPNSVDALLKVDEDTLLTGSSDGIIRVVTILPNKMIGVIGEHADYPIERLAFSHDKAILGSASHDNTVKLWNVNYLHDEDGEDDVIKTNEATSSDGVSVGTSSQSKDPPEAINSDDESDEDMEAEGSKQRKKKGKKGKQRSAPSKNSKFFEDL